MAANRIKHGRYCIFQKACILLFDTRSRKGRVIHVPSGWARDLVVAKDRDLIRSILENGECTPSTSVPSQMALAAK